MAQNNPNINAERIKGHLELDAGTTASATLRIRQGVTPSLPQNGDIWNNGINLVSQLNGTYSILNGNISGATGPTGSSGITGPTGPVGPNSVATNNEIVYGTGTGITSSNNLIMIGNNLSLQNNRIVNLATGSSNLDAINLSQLNTATQSIANKLNIGQYNISVGDVSGITGSSTFTNDGLTLKSLTGIRLNSTGVSTPTTINSSYYFVEATADIDLPQCTSAIFGQQYVIKNSSTSSSILVKPFTGDIIDDSGSGISLEPIGGIANSINSIILNCNGTEWYISSSHRL